jgi:hypothetical protein
MRPPSSALVIFLIASVCAAFPETTRSNCASGYSLCAPSGATSAAAPQIGDPVFESLFDDIILSSLPTSKRGTATGGTASLCCISSMSCLVMFNLAIPFCYDKFTTDYFLPDGSFGEIYGAKYISGSGDVANLLTGYYKLLNGTQGNIYSQNSSSKHDTATLPMPTQFTASGVGSAIPASVLGGEVKLTFTTILPGSTMPPTVIPPSTIPDTVTTMSIILPVTITRTVSNTVIIDISAINTVSIYTKAGTIVPGTTIPGSVVGPAVATITTTEASSMAQTSSTSSAAATGPKKNGAAGSWVSSQVHTWIVVMLMLLFIHWVY